jgi:HPt (histidine-containing phosphotransfer) domain-containing protein
MTNIDSKNKEPVNKDKLRDILATFMEDIEEWESEIEGSPTKADFASLDQIYDETIDELDREYFK